MNKLLTICTLLCALVASASDRITASITVTNITTNGMTFTVNGSTRTFTNNVVTSSTQVLTNDDVNGVGSKSNLFNQIALNPFAGQMALISTGTNTFTLTSLCGGALTVTASAGYASVSYSTQVCQTATPVGVPFSSYYTAPATRTNVGSGLVADLNTYATNQLSQVAPIAGELVGLTNSQTISGQKNFSNTNGFFGGLITSLAISGNSILLTNGLYLTPIFSSPTMTNGVNYGSAAFSSRGTNGTGAEQFGLNARATGDAALALGNLAIANGIENVAVGEGAFAGTNDFATALGGEAQAVGEGTLAVGESAQAEGFRAIAIGISAHAAESNAMALGAVAYAPFPNSFAVGPYAITTSTNQIMLGASNWSVTVQNNLNVQTNLTAGGNMTVSGNAAILGVQTNGTYTGTNNWLANSDIAFTRYALSSLANGNNTITPGTNVFIEVSGPTGAFSINSITGGRDGKLIIIINQTGQDMTISHQSGFDGTAANRIITMTGADRTTTGNGTATLIYSGSASRWILINFDP